MSRSTFIDLEETGQSEAESQLQFQEFHTSSVPPDVAQIDITSSSPGKEHTHTFSNFPDTALSDDDDGDETELLNRTTDGYSEKAAASVWTFKYYQQYFDVDSKHVGERVLWSMVPRPGYNYLQHYIRPRPDLYGPFWICLTLVFTTAVTGNLANYLQVAASGTYVWKYDFHKVSFAAVAIFSYAWLIPLFFFIFLWWRGEKANQAKITFLEVICLYGYSLAIYIPISILWVIQYAWLQWTLVLVGTALSGSVLLMALWAAVKDDRRRVAFAVMAILLLLHLLLAMGFMLYFFHVPTTEVQHQSVNPAVVVATTKPPPLPNQEVKNEEKPVNNGDKVAVDDSGGKEGAPDNDPNKRNAEDLAKSQLTDQSNLKKSDGEENKEPDKGQYNPVYVQLPNSRNQTGHDMKQT